MEPINLYLGEESRLVIENYPYKESIFKNSYDKALNVISEIISDNENNKSNERNPAHFFRQTADSVKNNIVAFLGDRGTGKTSCMLSVANMLKETKSISNGSNSINKIINSCSKDGFEILETIDPSFFDENANILDIVLGRLFSKFKDCVKKGNYNDQNCYDSQKENLFEQFQKVKESLSQMKAKNGICEDDNVDGLLKLTASVNMRNDIQELVSLYLDFINKDFLVVSIDDIDMHAEHAYEMAEEIRKYLKQPKIIVLMALKLEQLEQTIELHNRKLYDKMIGKTMTESDIADMSLKYIIKLIPENNRVYMPKASVWHDCVVNVYVESEGEGENVSKHNNRMWKCYDEKHINQTVKYYVTSMIFQKTRYLFYHSQENVSPIVPKNLRELRQLIELLCNMDDYSKQQRNVKNQELFKEYFLNTWVSNNLSINDARFMTEIFNLSDVSIVNKTILSKLKRKYDIYLDDQENELEKIFNEQNVSYNISLGDVLFVIKELKNKLVATEDRMFLFSIETFYSLKLYEYYDLRTEYEKIKERAVLNNSIDATIKKNDLLDELSEYEILVGGSFINISEEKFIAATQQNIRRDYRKISINALKEIIPTKKTGKLTSKELKQVQWIEFFLMFASRLYYGDSKKAGFSEITYRTRNEIIYNSQMTSGTFWFDISSLLFNLTNLDRQYERFDENFCNIVKDPKNDSLYNQIRTFCKEKRTVFSDSNESEEELIKHKILSWTSIRNIDVLEDLTRVINYSSTKTKDEKKRFNERKITINNKDLDEIYSFLHYIETFKILTYDKNEVNGKKEPYKINFEFLHVLTHFLEETKDFSIFDKIYNSHDLLAYVKEITDDVNSDTMYGQSTFRRILEEKFEPFKDDIYYNKFISANAKIRYRGYEINELIQVLKDHYISEFSPKKKTIKKREPSKKNVQSKEINSQKNLSQKHDAKKG